MRTVLPIIELPLDLWRDDPPGVVADPVRGHWIDCASGSTRLLLRVTQTDASARSITILAGDIAGEAGYGALTQSIDTDATGWLVLQSARFLRKAVGGRTAHKSSGIFLDLEDGFAGHLTVFGMAK